MSAQIATVAPPKNGTIHTTISIALVDGKIVVRGPLYNRDLCAHLLRLALEAIGDGQPAQTDAGAGGQRILLPGASKLTDLYHRGKRKV